jgi:predicted secreted Zn-dependent protease
VDTLKEELTLLRGKVDERFNEMHAEQRQLRRDFEKLIYWVAGLTVTNLLAIVGGP